MAESFLGSIIENLKVKITANTLTEANLKSELSKIENTLSKMQAIILDAEDKKAQNRHLNDWLFKLKDAIYDADDALNDVQYEVLKMKMVTMQALSPVPQVFSWLCFPNSCATYYIIAVKIKEIREKLAGILEAGAHFNLEERVEEDKDVVMKVRDVTSSLVRLSEVIGREAHKESIIALLTQEDYRAQSFSVVSIVGVGGIGKTVLAQSVYNDERVKKHFPMMKIWMCVTNDFDLSKLMKEIIKSQESNNDNLSACTDIADLKTRAQNILKRNRFLIILDDLWNEDRKTWIMLRDLLSNGSTGSKILITTRSMIVASWAGPICTCTLPGLSVKDSKLLFVKSAFKERQEEQYVELMEKAGNEIVKKCKGLPLVLITLGSLLYMNTNLHDWVFVRDNEMWKSNEFGALKLSYEKLPSYLKHCFACLSLFPKDCEFSGVDLIQLWMAQGLITSSTNEEMEEIGERYVKELWSRSFIQQVSEVYDLYSGFKMYDLVHDLAVIIAQNEFCSVNVHTQINIPKMIRHVSFYENDLSEEEVVNTLLNLNTSLRTVMFSIKGVVPFKNSFVETWVSRFKYLRVLDLRDSSFEMLSILVGGLKHLRLLNLSDNRHIKKLPNSICRLKNLQTLRLSGCSELERLPRNIGNLTWLRFLYITTKHRSLEIGSLISLRFLSISCCKNLKFLDEKVMERLTALRTLWIMDCESLMCVPSGLKHLAVLKIDGCPKLGKRCQTQGEDWHKIAHVRVITVDSQKIQSLTN